MAMQSHNKAQYATMTPYEIAKQDRRIIASLRQNMTVYEIQKRYRDTELRIKTVAAREGLTIAEGKFGPRKNKTREKADDAR